MKSISGTDRAKKIMLFAAVTMLGGMTICTCMAFLTCLEILSINTSQWLGTLLTDGLLLLLCWYVADRVGKNRLLTSAMIMGGYLLLRILIKNMLFAELPVVFDWRVVMPMISALCGSLLAGRRKERKR